MKSFAVLALLAAVAAAQSSNSSANPLIPSGISSTCTAYLTTLNSDTALSTCLQPLIQATAAFGPSATSNPSSSAVTSALSSACSSSNQCPSSTINTELGNFYKACNAELTTSKNSQVALLYDVLYSYTPFMQAVCSKDTNGKLCVTELQSNSSSSSSSSSSASSTSSAAKAKRTLSPLIARDTQVVLTPNATYYRQENLLFLLLQPSLPAAQLCTTCTREIVTAYTTQENTVPYAGGISNSPLLGGQSDLISGIQTKCGANFLQGSSVAAGSGLSGGLLGAAPRTADGQLALVGAALGALAVGVITAL